MEFNIESYLNSLPEDTTTINISCKNLPYIPSLSRFKNLEILYCYNNQITSLPHLNENLKFLDCSNNKLTSLPPLNEKLQVLYCYINKLTSLPHLNTNIEILNCRGNQLTSLPHLNENLKILECYSNQLTSLPTLNEKLLRLNFHDNPISEIITGQNISEIKIQIQKLKKFQYLYFCLKFKNQFRDWLWVKVREPKIMRKYYPSYLNSLDEDADLDEFLDNWIQ